MGRVRRTFEKKVEDIEGVLEGQAVVEFTDGLVLKVTELIKDNEKLSVIEGTPAL